MLPNYLKAAAFKSIERNWMSNWVSLTSPFSPPKKHKCQKQFRLNDTNLKQYNIYLMTILTVFQDG